MLRSCPFRDEGHLGPDTVSDRLIEGRAAHWNRRRGCCRGAGRSRRVRPVVRTCRQVETCGRKADEQNRCAHSGPVDTQVPGSLACPELTSLPTSQRGDDDSSRGSSMSARPVKWCRRDRRSFCSIRRVTRSPRRFIRNAPAAMNPPQTTTRPTVVPTMFTVNILGSWGGKGRWSRPF
jgi:hypothetical protein